MIVIKLFLQTLLLLCFVFQGTLFLDSMEKPKYDVLSKKRKRKILQQVKHPDARVISYLVQEKKKFLVLRSKSVQKGVGVEPKVAQDKKERHTKRILKLIQQKDFAKLVYRLRKGRVDLNHCNEYNKTPLYYACEQNLTDILYAILFYGGNPNIGASPLFIAIDHNNMLAVRHLCEHKADPNICENNKTPLYYACQKNVTYIIYVLLSYGGNPNRGTSPLFPAIEHQNKQVVESLLEYGADVNAQDDKGNSPFLCASEVESFSIVKLLLGNSGDQNKEK